MEALNDSTQAIIDESDAQRIYNLNIFFYLMISASGALVVSLIFLIPVLNTVKNNK